MANMYELTFTRPENTTAYGAGDVIGVADSETAANAGSAIHILRGGSEIYSRLVKIVNTEFIINLDAVPAGMTSFLMHLYSASPPSALLDAAAWDLPAGDAPYYIGNVTLGTPADVGSQLYIQTTGLSKYFRAPDAGLYAYIVTAAGYTPASATRMIVRAYTERNW